MSTISVVDFNLRWRNVRFLRRFYSDPVVEKAFRDLFNAYLPGIAIAPGMEATMIDRAIRSFNNVYERSYTLLNVK
jgi:hypothetical protein